MTVLPELERELLAAHQRSAARRRRAWAFPRFMARTWRRRLARSDVRGCRHHRHRRAVLGCAAQRQLDEPTVYDEGSFSDRARSERSRSGCPAQRLGRNARAPVQGRAAVRPGPQGRRRGRSGWRDGIESLPSARSGANRTSRLLRLGGERRDAEWENGRKPTEVRRYDGDGPQSGVGSRTRSPGIWRSVVYAAARLASRQQTGSRRREHSCICSVLPAARGAPGRRTSLVEA